HDGLPLEAPSTSRAAPAPHRRGGVGPRLDRRVGLRRQLGDGGKGRGRLPHQRTKDLLQRRSCGRPSDDERDRRGPAGGSYGPALRDYFQRHWSEVHDNWRTLGMLGTGSRDVTIEGVFVPEASIGVRRPRAKWHTFWDVVSTVA